MWNKKVKQKTVNWGKGLFKKQFLGNGLKEPPQLSIISDSSCSRSSSPMSGSTSAGARWSSVNSLISSSKSSMAEVEAVREAATLTLRNFDWVGDLRTGLKREILLKMFWNTSVTWIQIFEVVTFGGQCRPLWLQGHSQQQEVPGSVWRRGQSGAPLSLDWIQNPFPTRCYWEQQRSAEPHYWKTVAPINGREQRLVRAPIIQSAVHRMNVNMCLHNISEDSLLKDFIFLGLWYFC